MSNDNARHWFDSEVYNDDRLPKLRTIGDEKWKAIIQKYRDDNGGKFPNKRARNYLARLHGYELLDKKTHGIATDYMSRGARSADVRGSSAVMSYKGKRSGRDNSLKASPLQKPHTAR